MYTPVSDSAAGDSHSVDCKVTDSMGLSQVTSASVTINNPPTISLLTTAVLTAPISGAQQSANVQFTGTSYGTVIVTCTTSDGLDTASVSESIYVNNLPIISESTPDLAEGKAFPVAYSAPVDSSLGFSFKVTDVNICGSSLYVQCNYNYGNAQEAIIYQGVNSSTSADVFATFAVPSNMQDISQTYPIYCVARNLYGNWVNVASLTIINTSPAVSPILSSNPEIIIGAGTIAALGNAYSDLSFTVFDPNSGNPNYDDTMTLCTISGTAGGSLSGLGCDANGKSCDGFISPSGTSITFIGDGGHAVQYNSGSVGGTEIITCSAYDSRGQLILQLLVLLPSAAVQSLLYRSPEQLPVPPPLSVLLLASVISVLLIYVKQHVTLLPTVPQVIAVPFLPVRLLLFV